MKFNIGDEVSFLNEKLDGKIFSIVSSVMVKVETNDGFVIDALASELVLVKKAVEERSKSLSEAEEVKPPFNNNQKAFTYSANTIQFISAPAEDNKLMTGNINFYIYNCTNAEIFFVLFEQQGKDKIMKGKGALLPNTFSQTGNYKREELVDISNFVLQIISAGGEYRHPTVKDLPVILPSLNSSYLNADGTKSFAAYLEVVNFNKPKEEELVILKDTFKEKFETPLQKARTEKKQNDESRNNKNGVLENTAEIDLHIEKLIGDFTGLTNSEIMAVQLKKVVDEMESALRNNYYSLVFIHGVGNGKLKQALRDELKNYPNVLFKDANQVRYGGGATEVFFSV
ncbi:MAG TPA: hypothetical protein PKN75_05850 [Bacteroidia bacterium]|nr:hypothetical protein [Bacteroidia bacterium]HNU33098.1 hypothetical protein [Bacteroidia bacterium]